MAKAADAEAKAADAVARLRALEALLAAKRDDT